MTEFLGSLVGIVQTLVFVGVIVVIARCRPVVGELCRMCGSRLTIEWVHCAGRACTRRCFRCRCRVTHIDADELG